MELSTRQSISNFTINNMFQREFYQTLQSNLQFAYYMYLYLKETTAWIQPRNFNIIYGFYQHLLLSIAWNDRWKAYVRVLIK